MHLLNMKHAMNIFQRLMLSLIAISFAVCPAMASEEAANAGEDKSIDPKEIIFDHLGDG